MVSIKSVKQFRWEAPDAEKIWEEIIQTSSRLSLEPRMNNVDATQAERQLEMFGTQHMPNAYAQYKEARAKAQEVAKTVKEAFPKGISSDPTGGKMLANANKKLAVPVARMFRRRDELCFFLLFHQASIFSEDDLAKYDSGHISIHLSPELPDWPDDTPTAKIALSVEDAAFAGKYLPETHAGFERLCKLFDEGARQYAELRQTALRLDAPRARCELMMLKSRLLNIHATLQKYQKGFSMQRIKLALGDTTADQLTKQDQSNALKIQEYERRMGVKAYVTFVATHLWMPLPGGTVIEMVWCPPGTFMMGNSGNSEDGPQHQVTLTKGFWMGKTAVTQAQWKSVMGNNPSYFKGDNLPVEKVSWDDCQEFCRKTGLQLPTEAQWEYACRAGSMGPYAGTGNLDDMGWYMLNSESKTHPVGQKQPNAWGLYDMHGNVWEWCADWYGNYPHGAVTDPKGPSSGSSRVTRGGSFDYNSSICASSSRSDLNPSYGSNYGGFRLVRTLSE